MSIETRCTNCSTAFRVPEAAIGNRFVCRKCGKPFLAAATIKPPAVKAVDSNDVQWRIKSTNGEEFGPTSKSELDQWVSQGRINAGYQLLRDGDAQWQWATAVYPSLAEQEDAPAAIDLGTKATTSVASRYRQSARRRFQPSTSTIDVVSRHLRLAV